MLGQYHHSKVIYIRPNSLSLSSIWHHPLRIIIARSLSLSIVLSVYKLKAIVVNSTNTYTAIRIYTLEAVVVVVVYYKYIYCTASAQRLC